MKARSQADFYNRRVDPPVEDPVDPTPLLALLAPLLAVAGPVAQAADGDPSAGAQVAETCTRCHTLDGRDERTWGPDLTGIVGRPVGTEPGYRYGRFLREEAERGAVWTEASLGAWLVDSKAVARAAGSATKMPAQGLTAAQTRDLITYLRTLE